MHPPAPPPPAGARNQPAVLVTTYASVTPRKSLPLRLRAEAERLGELLPPLHEARLAICRSQQPARGTRRCVRAVEAPVSLPSLSSPSSPRQSGTDPRTPHGRPAGEAAGGCCQLSGFNFSGVWNGLKPCRVVVMDGRAVCGGQGAHGREDRGAPGPRRACTVPQERAWMVARRC